MHTVQRGKDVKEGAARSGREKEPLGSELAPRYDLPGDEQQSKGQGDVQSGQRLERRDETPGTAGDSRDSSTRPLERATTRQQDNRVDIEERWQLEVPPVRRAALPHHHRARQSRKRHADRSDGDPDTGPGRLRRRGLGRGPRHGARRWGDRRRRTQRGERHSGHGPAHATPADSGDVCMT